MFTAGSFSYKQHKWCNKLGHQPKHLLTLLQFLQLLLRLPQFLLQLPHGLLLLLALPVTGLFLLLEQPSVVSFTYSRVSSGEVAAPRGTLYPGSPNEWFLHCFAFISVRGLPAGCKQVGGKRCSGAMSLTL